MKDLVKQFGLEGKITEQHAKDIEAILENYQTTLIAKIKNMKGVFSAYHAIMEAVRIIEE